MWDLRFLWQCEDVFVDLLGCNLQVHTVLQPRITVTNCICYQLILDWAYIIFQRKCFPFTDRWSIQYCFSMMDHLYNPYVNHVSKFMIIKIWKVRAFVLNSGASDHFHDHFLFIWGFSWIDGFCKEHKY